MNFDQPSVRVNSAQNHVCLYSLCFHNFIKLLLPKEKKAIAYLLLNSQPETIIFTTNIPMLREKEVFK